jgi:uncharacterized protein YdeI (YjbR/CyaY-like superfamily)
VRPLEVGDADGWRAWLAANADTEREVWLVLAHARSGRPGVRYGEAIEQALCFGWIDSHARSHDATSSLLRFTPRRPQSRWSAPNRARIERLAAAGLVTEAGWAAVERARVAGTWDVSDDRAPAAAPTGDGGSPRRAGRSSGGGRPPVAGRPAAPRRRAR